MNVLMHSPAFLQGDFETAMKEIFNAVATRSMDKTEAGDPKLNLDVTLNRIRTEVGTEFAMPYYLHLLMKFATADELKGFHELGFIGDEAKNFTQLAVFLSDEFSDNSKTQIILVNDRVILEQFIQKLTDFPKGEIIKKASEMVVCPTCGGSGKFDETHKCLTCNGVGKVYAWEKTGDDINDEVLLELQQFINQNSGVIIELLYDWFMYTLIMMVYANTADDGSLGSRRNGYQSTDEYKFRGGKLLGTMEGRFNGTAPQADVSLFIPFVGVEFKVPIRILKEGKIVPPKPAPKPKCKDVKETPKRFTSATHDAPAKKVEDKPEDDPEGKSAYIYTKRNGIKIRGFSSTNDIKFKNLIIKEVFKCTNDTNGLLLYFSAEKYTRDEVRVAYSSLSKTPKSGIKVIKVIV